MRDALHFVSLRELTWSTRTRDAMGLKRRQSALVGIRAMVYNWISTYPHEQPVQETYMSIRLMSFPRAIHGREYSEELARRFHDAPNVVLRRSQPGSAH